MKPLRKNQNATNGSAASKDRPAVVVNVPPQDRLVEFIKSGNTEAVVGMATSQSDRRSLTTPHSKSGMLPLCVAADEGILECVDALLEAEVSPNLVDLKGMTPLMYAAKNGTLKIIELLISFRAEVDIAQELTGENCLFMASRHHRLAAVKYFAETQQMQVEIVNNKEETPLWNALKTERTDIASALLKYGANVNYQQSSTQNAALHAAVFHNRLSIVKFILDHGGDIHIRNRSGDSALIIASRFGFIEILEELLARGANVLDCDGMGKSALCAACLTEKEDVIRLLLSKGANVNAVDRWKYSPLMLMVKQPSPNLELVRLLLESKANVNAVENCYRSALMHSCAQSHWEAVELLLDHGANACLRNMDSLQAIDLLSSPDDKDRFVRLLEVHAQPLHQQSDDSRPAWMEEINLMKDVVQEAIAAQTRK